VISTCPSSPTFIRQALEIPAIAKNRKLHRRCLKWLCRISGHHCLLPLTHKLTSPLRKENKPICSGGFAEVWKGTYCYRQVAVKVLKVYQTSDIEKIGKVRYIFLEADQQTTVSSLARHCQRFCKEVLMWNRLSHPNILPLLGAAQEGWEFTMVSEWMDNGNIRQYVLAHPKVNRPSLVSGSFPHPFRMCSLCQLLDVIHGLMYLHSQNLVHGDLKGVSGN